MAWPGHRQPVPGEPLPESQRSVAPPTGQPEARLLEVRHLTRTYGQQRVVDRVSFTVPAGEVLGLAGPNGAGKSTLLAMMAGILRPDAGEVRLGGCPVAALPRPRGRLVGYVPQNLALHLPLTVKENLRFWGEMAGTPHRELPERMAEVAAAMGLSRVLRTRVQHLSGGLQRKVHIAAALVSDPALLILDEPTAGVDVKGVQEILAFLKAQAQQGRTVIYSSHSTDELQVLCDRFLLLNRGRVAFLGSRAEVLAAARRWAPDATAPLSWAEVLARLGGW